MGGGPGMENYEGIRGAVGGGRKGGEGRTQESI